jgi:hypothetical protein
VGDGLIKPPSLQSGYTLVWSQDPALDLPEDAAERERALHRAQLTGTWPIKSGHAPTTFHFRNLSRSDLNWIAGETTASTEHGRPLVGVESDDLLVRLALDNVDNFGTVAVKHARVGSQKKVATSETIDAIYEAVGEHGSALLAEFAQHIFKRAQHQLDPL